MSDQKKIRTAVIGGTGQVGESLLRILVRHPNVEIAVVTSDHAPGQPVSESLPALRGVVDLLTVETDAALIAQQCDVAFCAKKAKFSMEIAPKLLDANVRFIDIGGEFRFQDKAIYEKWYGEKHLCPDRLSQTVYGLPELFRADIRAARLIGNPGCYPTTAIVPLAPFIREKLIDPSGIIVDAYSGLSGAGRQYSDKSRNLFVDATENVRAYAVGKHKHTPEIEMALSAAGAAVTVLFSPHLAPMERGIFATIYGQPTRAMTTADALGVLHRTYDSEPFVRVFDDPSSVETKNARDTNFVDVSAFVDSRTNRLILFSALDNTVKGAAGQAIQNMNVMFGLPETTGLL
ncbi:MAG: N-acetyl-gamma-glutamyl-phosphate reductase [Planctomycetota bacterium]